MIQDLFNKITEEKRKLVEMMDLFGEDYWAVNNLALVIIGMEDAFKVITGHSYTYYLLNERKLV